MEKIDYPFGKFISVSLMSRVGTNEKNRQNNNSYFVFAMIMRRCAVLWFHFLPLLLFDRKY